MGVINVTPDSFSDGGTHFDHRIAAQSAREMEAQGAAVIDVGGESTRPGATAVSLQEELDRVIPVIELIRRESDLPISIDTMKAEVARLAAAAGADIINDVTALRFDDQMPRVAMEHGMGVILMHMRGEPRTMQDRISYRDLMGEIRSELTVWRNAAIEKGVAEESLMVDPGIGFGKSFEHNLEILARAGELNSLGPVVIGGSRKGFVGHLTGRPGGKARMAGSLAAVAAAARACAAMVRVHDVAETVDFLKVYAAIVESSGDACIDQPVFRGVSQD